ncbi:MAG: hypothetical protein IIB00_00175 [candidate division Zixibacteria bacterium]|nr:hypothetical protein [candidate division Zixibacteria bacterium]
MTSFLSRLTGARGLLLIVTLIGFAFSLVEAIDSTKRNRFSQEEFYASGLSVSDYLIASIHSSAREDLTLVVDLSLAFAGAALDCDSLEESKRVTTDTTILLNSFGFPGDTILIPFYIQNDSILGAFSFFYEFDTSLLEPIIIADTLVECNPSCDTFITYYIETIQNARADSSGMDVSGLFDPETPTIARLFAIPFDFTLDSLQVGGDTLCHQKFKVKESAKLGCIGEFNFVAIPLWQVDTSFNPPESTFIGCRLNEYATYHEDTVLQVIPTTSTGYFRVGATADFECGDANADGTLTISDAIFLVEFIFQDGAFPCLIGGIGDFDCSGEITINDAVKIVLYIFGDGEPPCCPPGF